MNRKILSFDGTSQNLDSSGLPVDMAQVDLGFVPCVGIFPHDKMVIGMTKTFAHNLLMRHVSFTLIHLHVVTPVAAAVQNPPP